MLTFNSSFQPSFPPEFPVSGLTAIVAYWDPLFSTTAAIAFRETNSPELLERCENDIQKYLNTSFPCFRLVIVTWIQVEGFSDDDTQVVFDSCTPYIVCIVCKQVQMLQFFLLFCDNTYTCTLQGYHFSVFQAVLASSETTSAVLLNYGTLQFDRGSGAGFVGFSAGDGIRSLQFPESGTPAAQNLPLLSNVNVSGVFAFRTDGILIQGPEGMFVDISLLIINS